MGFVSIKGFNMVVQKLCCEVLLGFNESRFKLKTLSQALGSTSLIKAKPLKTLLTLFTGNGGEFCSIEWKPLQACLMAYQQCL